VREGNRSQARERHRQQENRAQAGRVRTMAMHQVKVRETVVAPQWRSPRLAANLRAGACPSRMSDEPHGWSRSPAESRGYENGGWQNARKECQKG
jgi:hypothetical protein